MLNLVNKIISIDKRELAVLLYSDDRQPYVASKYDLCIKRKFDRIQIKQVLSELKQVGCTIISYNHIVANDKCRYIIQLSK